MSSSPRPSGTTPSPVCLPSLCVRTLLCVPTSCSPISTMQARDSPRKLAISDCRGWATCTLASRVIGTLSVFRSYCLVCVRAARGNRELLAFAGARERGASILPLLGPCHTPWPLSHSFGPERLTSALCRGKSHVLPSGLRMHSYSLLLILIRSPCTWCMACRAVSAVCGRAHYGKQNLLTQDATVIPYGLDLYAVPFESKVCLSEFALKPRAKQRMRPRGDGRPTSVTAVGGCHSARLLRSPEANARGQRQRRRVGLWRVPLAFEGRWRLPRDQTSPPLLASSVTARWTGVHLAGIVGFELCGQQDGSGF